MGAGQQCNSRSHVGISQYARSTVGSTQSTWELDSSATVARTSASRNMPDQQWDQRRVHGSWTAVQQSLARRHLAICPINSGINAEYMGAGQQCNSRSHVGISQYARSTVG